MGDPVERVVYSLEIYFEGFSGQPECSVDSPAPFLSFHAGDYLQLGMWGISRGYRTGEIMGVRHNIYNVPKRDLTHQIQICYRLVPSKDLPGFFQT